MALLHSSRLYITVPWLYFTVLESTLLYYGSTLLYETLHYPIKALLQSTRNYITLTWIYFTLHNATMAILHAT